MNAKNFLLLLRKVIREEVQTAVRNEVKLLLKEQQRAHEVKGPKPAPTKLATVLGGKPKSIAGLPASNPLAAILSETAESMRRNPDPPEQSMDWMEMGDTFTAEQAPGFVGSAIADLEAQGVDPHEGDHFAGDPQAGQYFGGDPTMAFVKNYSAVMQSADKFANKG